MRHNGTHVFKQREDGFEPETGLSLIFSTLTADSTMYVPSFISLRHSGQIVDAILIMDIRSEPISFLYTDGFGLVSTLICAFRVGSERETRAFHFEKEKKDHRRHYGSVAK